ncbi:uncharacterized protein V1518DRAFT_414976 [Limtongia smithiae]|uniref:uncharacterized protein n=1 Tax=Limtongia smithiae TaxID=1125753 RepID=UPI0034CDA44B
MPSHAHSYAPCVIGPASAPHCCLHGRSSLVGMASERAPRHRQSARAVLAYSEAAGVVSSSRETARNNACADVRSGRTTAAGQEAQAASPCTSSAWEQGTLGVSCQNHKWSPRLRDAKTTRASTAQIVRSDGEAEAVCRESRRVATSVALRHMTPLRRVHRLTRVLAFCVLQRGPAGVRFLAPHRRARSHSSTCDQRKNTGPQAGSKCAKTGGDGRRSGARATH